MSKIILRFASWKDKNDIFLAVKKGIKTIETRPATEKYSSIKIGDILELESLDTREKVKKTASFVHIYRSIEKMAKNEVVEQIIPGVKTPGELVRVFEEFKKKWGKEYAEKLEKYGIVAIGLD